MKNHKTLILLVSFAVGLIVTGPAQTAVGQEKKPAADASDKKEPAAATPAPEPKAAEQAPPPATSDVILEAARTSGSETNKGLRLNFRGVPVRMVLDCLADATDFIINIVPGTDVSGKVEVWSNQPLDKEEAFKLLNKVLNQNSLAAIREGRTLTIVSRLEAKKERIPVRSGNTPEDIPQTDAMVTQVIPVRYANATQLIQNLTPLLPDYASLTANQSGNALVLTDTEADVRRMVEIVKALDTSISSISTLKGFPLK